MSKGCIQGSVCGPTMWNLLLDELLGIQLPSGCHIQAFSDDILLVITHPHLDQIESLTNQILTQITTWGKKVKLDFSPQKTQLIGFTNKTKNCKIIMNNHPIKHLKEIKYLGIIIDNKLKFIKHSEYIIEKSKKLFNKLTTFIRPTWGIHPENVKIIYKQVIEPIICYGASIWNSALQYKIIFIMGK